MHQDNRLDLAEMVPALVGAIEEARRKIKEIFRERASERAKVVVEDWKSQNVYPFEGEANTQIERAERQIFRYCCGDRSRGHAGFQRNPAPANGVTS